MVPELINTTKKYTFEVNLSNPLVVRNFRRLLMDSWIQETVDNMSSILGSIFKKLLHS